MTQTHTCSPPPTAPRCHRTDSPGQLDKNTEPFHQRIKQQRSSNVRKQHFPPALWCAGASLMIAGRWRIERVVNAHCKSQRINKRTEGKPLGPAGGSGVLLTHSPRGGGSSEMSCGWLSGSLLITGGSELHPFAHEARAKNTWHRRGGIQMCEWGELSADKRWSDQADRQCPPDLTSQHRLQPSGLVWSGLVWSGLSRSEPVSWSDLLQRDRVRLRARLVWSALCSRPDQATLLQRNTPKHVTFNKILSIYSKNTRRGKSFHDSRTLNVCKKPSQSLFALNRSESQLTGKTQLCHLSYSWTVNVTSGIYVGKASALLQTHRFWKRSHALKFWAHFFERRLKVKGTKLASGAGSREQAGQWAETLHTFPEPVSRSPVKT